MKLLLHPFFSQQDKRTGKFLLESDSGVKLYAYIAERAAERGWYCRMVMPPSDQCADRVSLPCEIVRPSMYFEQDNLSRRFQWDPAWLRFIGAWADVFLTQHEFLAYPLRCLGAQCRIAMECGIRPDTAWPQTRDMFPLAWAAADLVHCNSYELAAMVAPHARRTTVWQFSWQQDIADAPPSPCKDIDALFNARCSATGYSNHEIFMAAVGGTGLRAVMTDPTSYLRRVGGPGKWVPPEPLARREYIGVLRRSRCAVGLTLNGYGGHAFVEAVAAGAVPVAVRSPEYEELLTPEWPYFARSLDPEHVRAALQLALDGGWPAVPTRTVAAVSEAVASRSYSVAWQRACKDLEELSGC